MIIKKILKVLFFIFIFESINILLFSLYTKNELKLTKTYISTNNINPREKIKDEDLKEIQVPYKYINNDAFLNKKDIIGKYTDISGKIPKGSLFYKNMLFDEKDLPDFPYLKLKDNQVIFTLSTDLISLSGNSIVEDQIVDIYGTINISKSQFIQDLLISDVRVVSIKDSKGYSLDNPNSNKIPNIINLAINKEDLKYIYYISSIGKIDIFSNSNAYNKDVEAKLNTNSKLINFYEENKKD